MPFFSIILPTFNSGNTLSGAIESLLKQYFTDFEILIMDGLSSDNTIGIVKKFNDARIKIFSEKDYGIYDAMNKGIKLASGEWIYFLGSDDKLYNQNILESIHTIAGIIKENIIYGDVLIDGDAGWARNEQIYDGQFSLAKLIRGNICHQGIFYKKIVFAEHGFFNTKYRICADWDFNLKLWSKYPFFYTKLIIAIFKGGNSSCLIENNYGDIEKWTNILKYFRIKLLSSQFSEFSQKFLVISRFYFENKKYFKGILLKFIYYFHKIRTF